MFWIVAGCSSAAKAKRMSSIHAVTASAAEVTAHFGAEPADGLDVSVEMVEGWPCLVVFERGGRSIAARDGRGLETRYSREYRSRR